MGILDIDDRDTYNTYYGQTVDVARSKEWLLQLKAANPAYRCVSLSCNLYKLDFTLNCTGADIESIINIPLMHSLNKIEIKHVDSSNLDSTDKFNYTVYRNSTYNLYLLLYKYLNVVHSDIMDELHGFTNEGCQYKIISNSTNTDMLYFTVYITIIGN